MFDRRRRLSDYVVGSFVGSLSAEANRSQVTVDETEKKTLDNNPAAVQSTTTQDKMPKPAVK